MTKSVNGSRADLADAVVDFEDDPERTSYARQESIADFSGIATARGSRSCGRSTACRVFGRNIASQRSWSVAITAPGTALFHVEQVGRSQ
jgi:hypothetical protein